jgi:hypothetical protein
MNRGAFLMMAVIVAGVMTGIKRVNVLKNYSLQAAMAIAACRLAADSSINQQESYQVSGEIIYY